MGLKAHILSPQKYKPPTNINPNNTNRSRLFSFRTFKPIAAPEPIEARRKNLNSSEWVSQLLFSIFSEIL